ncbi:MAG: hypothetical protein A2798_01505 [Candidatus Levybacteria bacterium RIFCSPHIGHO2_01_FULL_37_17]|nr:MAG: hypothetical protein A2798_01505 [Candidatus Levybacteria bacterium RIFCSPHIGHO2_01_FULL_37_17]OGH37125.1 MAG: hypothetical protein A2959_02365 [Candidatus Levybacteria bacterium RIFCSPLOWO2_01_FULL_38_23]
MKHKHFYSYLIESTDITLELGELRIKKEERLHLLSLVDANLHSSVVATVLEQLDREDKKIFLKNLSEGTHDKIWRHLNLKIKNAEERIQASVRKVTKELVDDIRKAHKLNKNSKS